MIGRLLVPWHVIEDERRRPLLRAELERELAPTHVLAGRSAHALAYRQDCDDVLFEIDGLGFAVVHLTWKGRQERDPSWPDTEVFGSLDDWMQRMRDDHEDFFAGE